MSTRVVERVDDWNERPFGDGYRELHDLADAEFSGVVRAGGAELYMTRGTVIGIRRGSIEDFEGASGTIYDAPTDALPLLAIMQERSDEVRAKYYSEDTSISEVDRTLESGGFTGYVELSENVLSGDYYLVYHQGHSMSVAYVGNAEQLLTDDEAFERANDEVGIYEVRPVDIEPIEIPEPPEPEPEPEETASVAVEDDVDESTPVDAETDTTTADDEDALESQASMDTPEPAETPTPAPDSGDEPESASPRAAASADDDDEIDDPMATRASAESDTGQATDVTHEESAPTTRAETETDEGPTETETEHTAESDRRTEPQDNTEQTTSEPSPGEELTTPPSPEPDSETEPDTVSGGEGAALAETEPSTTDPAQEPEQTAAGAEPSQPDSRRTEATSADESRTASPPTPTPDATQQTEGETTDELSSRTDGPSSLETRSIPSLDPERTSTRSGSSGPRRDAPGRDTETPSATGTTGTQSTGRSDEPARQDEQPTADSQQPTEQSEQTTSHQPESETATAEQSTQTPETKSETETGEAADTPTADASEESESAVSERVDELQDLLTERETEIRQLEADLETAESERDSVQRKLEQVREERDELEAQVEKLESELQRLEEELGAATNAQQRMTPQEALSGTDLFVRYRSKGDATLEKAHDGGAIRSDVSENIRLEKHTQFDADISAVGGREYDEFLEDTVSYRFVRWVVEDLLFEIQSTGHTESLSELYDALPKINRIELNGAVTVTVTENGQETQSTETFDVVFRERMGDPLLVANINESRQGASETMMEGLITAAERVGKTSDQFASAFLVTESFFEPEALETVAEATRGGILSRDKRKSFVNLSRKQGYHLCLVEARNQNFHLEVPEL